MTRGETGSPGSRRRTRRAVRLGRLLWVALVVAGSSQSTPLAAQARRGPPPDREQLEQRIRAQMGRIMQERLGLDDEQATRLSSVVQDFDGRRRELFTLEQATRRRVEALLLEGGNDQQEARELIDRMADLRLQEAQLFAAEQRALLDVLTPAQVLRLQDLRQDLGRRIRALEGGRGGEAGSRRERGSRGPGPGAFRDGGPGPAPGPDRARSGRVPLG